MSKTIALTDTLPALIRFAPLAIIVANLDGEVWMWNPAATELFGWTESEAIGQFLPFVPPGKRSEFQEFREALLKGETVRNREVQRVCKDGSWLDVSLSLAPLRNVADEITGLIYMIADVTQRKRTEGALRETELRYHKLFQQSPDSIVIIDPETTAIVEFNDAACRQLGYSREEFTKQCIFDFEAAETPEETRLHAQELLDEGQITFETLHRTKQGEIRNVVVAAHLIELGGKTFIQAVFSDITDHKRAEESLQASEAQYRAIVEDQTELIIRWTKAGDITFVNDAACRYVNLTRGELIGKTFYPYIYEEDRPLVAAAIQSLTYDNPVVNIEHRLVLPSGKLRWCYWVDRAIFSESGELIEYQSVGRDITEHRQAEEQLRLSEKRFRSLIENSSDAIALLNAVGVISFASPSSLRILGYSIDEMVGRNAFEFLHADDLPEAQRLFVQLFNDPSKPITHPVRFRHKNGEWLWIETTGVNLLADPSVEAIVVNYHDITERKRAEAEIRLLHTTTLAISEASDFHAALQGTLQKICEAIGWNFGEVWIPRSDGNALELDSAWYGSDPGLEKFRKASEGFSFRLGEGLPGRVWATKQSEWISDVSVNGQVFLRAQSALEGGFNTGVCVPVLCDDEVFVVFGFLAFGTHMEDRRLMETISAVAAQLCLILKRKWAEESLRENQTRFEGIVNTAIEGIISIDEDQRVILFNKGAERIFGYIAEEAVGLPLDEFLPPTSIGLHHRLVQHFGAIEGDRSRRMSERREIQGRRRDGSVFPAEVSISKTTVRDKIVYTAILQDITERKRMEEESAKLYNAVEQSADIIFITNLDGTIEYINPAFEVITGYSKEETIGNSPRIFNTGLMKPEYFSIVWTTIRSGEVFRGEVINKKKNGEIFHYDQTITPIKDTHGNITHFVSTGRDVTERKWAEEELRRAHNELEARVAQRTAELASAYSSLRESERFIQHVADATPDVIFVFDLVEQRVMYVNNRVHDVLGYSIDEIHLLGANFVPRVMRSEDLSRMPQIVQRFETLISDEVLEGEYRMQHKDGRWRWLSMRLIVFQRTTDNHPRQILGAMQDVTERKEVEEALYWKNEHLTALYEISLELLNRRDLPSLLQSIVTRAATLVDAAYCYLYLVEGEELVVVATTKGFHQFLGWSLRRGEGLSGRVWQEGRSITLEDYASWSGRNTAYDEWQIHAESAVPIWCDGICVGVLGAARLGEDRRVFNSTEVENLTRFATLVAVVLDNVRLYLKTQHELAERQQSEARLQAILDNSPAYIYLKSVPERRYLLMNRRMEQWFNAPRGSLLGKTDYELYPFESAENFRVVDERVLEYGEAVSAEEVLTLPDGKQVVNLSIKFPLRDENGGVYAIGGISSDITERKSSEVQLNELNAELQTQARELARSNADLEQFAFAASHDLQEPLRMVISYSQLMSKRYKGKLDADADEFINYAVNGAMRMQAMIKGLLTYSRLGRQGETFGLIDCNSALRTALANLQFMIEDHQAVITQDTLPTVYGNMTLIAQLFQNLLSNAIKFCLDRTPRVHVEVEMRVNDGLAEWVFAVSDNGIGIAREQLERAFVIFQRLHTQIDIAGTGIGLATCKRIVERHGGRIWVESEEGKGSTFYFAIPDQAVVQR